MYLTASFKIRANDHDRGRLNAALRRWHHALRVALDNASDQRKEFVSCIRWWEPEKEPDPVKRKAKGRFVVDGKARHELIKACCKVRTHLHSSAEMSLIRALEETIGSWLGLYCRWMAGERKDPKPGWPTLPPLSALEAERAWEMTLDASQFAMDLETEDQWRADVLRGPHDRPLPMDFGAATAGAHDPKGKVYLHHCGLLERSDGRYFALMTLWPGGDPLGEPLERARNRRDRGALRNVRDDLDFVPGARSRAAICCPLEMGRGHEHLFFGRAKPQSAQLARRGDDYFLHVAFEFADHTPIDKTGNILAIRRGIDTLIAAVVIDGNGRVLEKARVEGRDLKRLISEIKSFRAKRQQQGKSIKGDAKASRVAEHHVYSACHQIIALAYRHGAETVMLAPPKPATGAAVRPQGKGRPGPGLLMAYRHFARIEDSLAYLFAECGLAPARSLSFRKGSARTCPACGWQPGDNVRYPEAQGGECPSCRRVRDETFDTAENLALEVLCYRRHTERENRPTLGEFVRSLKR